MKRAAESLCRVVRAFLATSDFLENHPKLAARVWALITDLWPLGDTVGEVIANLRSREHERRANALAVGMRGALRAPTLAALRTRLPTTAFKDSTPPKVVEAIVEKLEQSAEGRTNEALARHVVTAGLRAMGLDPKVVKNLFSREQGGETETDAVFAERRAALASELLVLMGVAQARAASRKSRAG